MRRFALLLLLTLPVVTACEDEPLDPVVDDGSGDTALVLKDLSEKWHVLNNVEYAYKQRRLDVYDELLNVDFTFFFAPGDVGGGIPTQWDRQAEWSVTRRLFESNAQPAPPSDPVCRSIRMDLQYDPDTMQWVEVDPKEFPTEKWCATTVFYTFTFEMEPDLTLIAQNGAKAQFTVRKTGTDQDPHWELVELRDLGN